MNIEYIKKLINASNSNEDFIDKIRNKRDDILQKIADLRKELSEIEEIEKFLGLTSGDKLRARNNMCKAQQERQKQAKEIRTNKIKNFLESVGEATTKEIAEKLGLKPIATKKLLRELNNKGFIIEVDINKWLLNKELNKCNEYHAQFQTKPYGH